MNFSNESIDIACINGKKCYLNFIFKRSRISTKIIMIELIIANQSKNRFSLYDHEHR